MNGVPVGTVLGAGRPWTERRIITPLGIRFRDIALEEPITHGLVVLVKRRDLDGDAIPLAANPSGIFGFHNMPGLHDFEYPGSAGPTLGSPPPTVPFVVAVADRLGRFLPAMFGVDLPLPPIASPPLVDIDPDRAPVLDAFLFTAPTRPVTCGLAAVRADLFDCDAEQRAGHARVRVTVGNRLRIGVADERGRVLVLLPWPPLERLRLGSPPGSGQAPIEEQTLPVTVEAWYQPDLPRLFASDAALPEPWIGVPGLKGILECQDRVWVHPSRGGPPVMTWSGEITYDRELVIRTETESELWISRGASPL